MAHLCANTERVHKGERRPCLQLARNACKGCFLVQYCSKECQRLHWDLHKRDCKSPLMKATWRPSWDIEGRQPTFVSDSVAPFTSYGKQKFLWGNTPALDIINSSLNEAANLPKDLHLLFAASGDIRNMVKTLTGLPHSYNGNCEIVINDRDFDIMARNAILLLVAFHFSSENAAPIMLHIWYSALIPEHIFHSLQQHILPLVQKVCTQIASKPAEALQSKTWKSSTRSLRIVLRKEQWDCLLSYLAVPDGLSVAHAQDVRTLTTLALERRDYLDRALYNVPPALRVPTMKFRRDGILLPFGSSRTEFNIPNPTFYQTKDGWPMMDSADPLAGWAAKDVREKALLAKNDIYGHLHTFLTGILLKFCHHVEKYSVNFQLFHLDALDLPGTIAECGMGRYYFDRIEVSNIADRGYLGPQAVLSTFAPLLKRKTQNASSSLLTLFLNTVHEVFTDAEDAASLPATLLQVQQYLKVTPDMFQPQNKYSADVLRLLDARAVFRNYDELFDRFMRECRLDDLGTAAGLKRRSRHTIIEPWPMRLRPDATKSEFEALRASGHTGSERYVEWESLA